MHCYSNTMLNVAYTLPTTFCVKEVENVLKDEQRKRGLSQSELSRLTGIPVRTISYWETGHTPEAKVKSLKKVADALGCKVDDLL